MGYGPFTHTQYKDRPGEDLEECPGGDHHWLDDEDTGEFVCSRCGLSDVEGEPW